LTPRKRERERLKSKRKISNQSTSKEPRDRRDQVPRWEIGKDRDKR